MARTSAAVWAKRVGDWEASGLKAKEFAAETGLNASTLSYWRWKLRAEADESRQVQPVGKRSVKPKRRAKAKRPDAAPAFVEVPVASVATTSAALEVVLGDMRVRVPVGFDELTLTRVVRAVEAAR